ncbi:MAG: DUF115 domain-containing protein [Planctomycetia bacterium]|nr:DUF115 domain-containing protein [Planctomycetia bacterium]
MYNYLVNKLLNTYNRDGISGLIRKSFLRIKTIIIRKNINDKNNKIRWDRIKGKYQGEDVFVIGNGPSLNKTPLYLLKDKYTMCFNRFNLFSERINWHPDFYLTTDNLVLSDIIEELNTIIPTTTYSFFPDVHFRGEKFIGRIPSYKNVYWIEQVLGKGFSNKLPKIYPGGTVICEAFQILAHLGFTKIYLIGVDMNYQVHKSVKQTKDRSIDIISQENDDPNHFDPRYFGKNKKYHQPEDFVITNIIKDLDYIAKVITNHNIEIINIGFESKLDSFHRENFNEVLDFTSAQKETLFNECLKKNTTISTVKIYEKEHRLLKSSREWHSDLTDFYTKIDTGLKIINKAIFTHIPVGPFNNKYYFVKRN